MPNLYLEHIYNQELGNNCAEAGRFIDKRLSDPGVSSNLQHEDANGLGEFKSTSLLHPSMLNPDGTIKMKSKVGHLSLFSVTGKANTIPKKDYSGIFGDDTVLRLPTGQYKPTKSSIVWLEDDNAVEACHIVGLDSMLRDLDRPDFEVDYRTITPLVTLPKLDLEPAYHNKFGNNLYIIPINKLGDNFFAGGLYKLNCTLGLVDKP